ncbi:hypothetical protein [Pseudanabaena sp. UWO310]|uniref:hypothetical protein n=1 Tax=Pseudanabaena sp. UWO310 TaxID=2480795 RepID=UPI0011608F10|nr:hypothetical protein [Pseudanabaena sp. UWO310]TYQ24533.1 hypothetical protein PseudUWO310_20670 [Pseudanabaena sp. UWO310]
MDETTTIDGSWTLFLGELSATLLIVQDGDRIGGIFANSSEHLSLKGNISRNRQVNFTIESTKRQGWVGKFEGVINGNVMNGTTNLPKLGNSLWSASRQR